MWNEGYVTDIDYTHGYYSFLTPNHLRMAALVHNLPVRIDDDFSYLELGFGQGLTLNIAAAANPGRYWGNDFNPSQVENAQRMARASGADLTLTEDSFEELAARPDLPAFDMIVLHGIWSWVSQANRHVITDIIRRKLRPGGILFVSYNAQPGWAAGMPLRHLMSEHASRTAAASTASKVSSALDFADRIVAAEARYFTENPSVTKKLESLKKKDATYLAHEFLNSEWHPVPFSQTAAMLAGAKMQYATQGRFLDLVDPLNFSPEALKFLGEIEDPVLRETVRDYFLNRSFRRDIFVKGGQPLSPREKARAFRDMRFTLLRPPEAIELKTTGTMGEMRLRDVVYQPVIDALAADDSSPKSLAEIQASDGCRDHTVAQLIQVLLVLGDNHGVVPVHDAATARAQIGKSRALNSELLRLAEQADHRMVLAAPLTGSGLHLARMEQLFLRAMELGQDPPGFVWSLFKSEGRVLSEGGRAIDGDDANLAKLRAHQATFEKTRMPLLKRLGIV